MQRLRRRRAIDRRLALRLVVRCRLTVGCGLTVRRRSRSGLTVRRRSRRGLAVRRRSRSRCRLRCRCRCRRALGRGIGGLRERSRRNQQSKQSKTTHRDPSPENHRGHTVLSGMKAHPKHLRAACPRRNACAISHHAVAATLCRSATRQGPRLAASVRCARHENRTCASSTSPPRSAPTSPPLALDSPSSSSSCRAALHSPSAGLCREKLPPNRGCDRLRPLRHT